LPKFINIETYTIMKFFWSILLLAAGYCAAGQTAAKRVCDQMDPGFGCATNSAPYAGGIGIIEIYDYKAVL